MVSVVTSPVSRRPLSLFAGAAVAVTAAVLPVSAVQLGTSVGSVSALVSVLACFDLISVYLLVGDFRDRGSMRWLAMAWAYSSSLVVMTGYALASPARVDGPAARGHPVDGALPLRDLARRLPGAPRPGPGSVAASVDARCPPHPPAARGRRLGRRGGALRLRGGHRAGRVRRPAAGPHPGPGHHPDDEPDRPVRPSGHGARARRDVPRHAPHRRSRAVDHRRVLVCLCDPCSPTSPASATASGGTPGVR